MASQAGGRGAPSRQVGQMIRLFGLLALMLLAMVLWRLCR